MKQQHPGAPGPDASDPQVAEVTQPEPAGWRRIRFPGSDSPDADTPGSAAAVDPERRRDARIHASFRVRTTFVDPVRDPVTNEPCYHTSDDDIVFSVSRRGAGLRCARPPELGTRLLLEIEPADQRTPIEVIGRTCWTRVEYVPGEQGARAVAAVGVEFMGGSSASLDRYEWWLARLEHRTADLVATPMALG